MVNFLMEKVVACICPKMPFYFCTARQCSIFSTSFRGGCGKLITGFSLQASFVSVVNYNQKLPVDYSPHTARTISTTDLPGNDDTQSNLMAG